MTPWTSLSLSRFFDTKAFLLSSQNPWPLWGMTLFTNVPLVDVRNKRWNFLSQFLLHKRGRRVWWICKGIDQYLNFVTPLYCNALFRGNENPSFWGEIEEKRELLRGRKTEENNNTFLRYSCHIEVFIPYLTNTWMGLLRLLLRGRSIVFSTKG